MCLVFGLTHTPFVTVKQGMEANEQPRTHPPPSSPTQKYKIGDLVHVFQGTAGYVKARNTVAFIGRIVGHNKEDAKWEVNPLPPPL